MTGGADAPEVESPRACRASIEDHPPDQWRGSLEPAAGFGVRHGVRVVPGRGEVEAERGGNRHARRFGDVERRRVLGHQRASDGAVI